MSDNVNQKTDELPLTAHKIAFNRKDIITESLIALNPIAQ